MSYKLSNEGWVFRLADSSTIPKNPDNQDYQDYLVWLSEGNTPLPADPLPIPVIKANLSAAVQQHLDGVAISRNYDSVLSACSYAAVPNLFQAESIKFIEWRSAVWAACYGILGAVEAGLRQIPTEAELLAELPQLS